MLDLSLPTVRKKIDSLVDKGVLTPIYGGVEYGKKSTALDAEMNAIAKEAVKLIAEGDSIYLGPGRTVAAMCPHLKNYSGLTVFTNSLRVLQSIADIPNITLFSIGGMYQPSNMAFTLHSGYPENININKAFVSATAIDPDQGLSHRLLANKETSEIVSSNAKKIIFLGTKDKFQIHGPFVVMPIEAVNVLISSEGLNPALVQKIKDKNIEVHLAPL